MASYTVASNDNGVGAWTLVAGQVDTVTFTDNISIVRVISDGAAEAVVTFDGSTPTMPTPGASTRTLRLPVGMACERQVSIQGTADTVKFLSSAGGAKVSVENAL